MSRTSTLIAAGEASVLSLMLATGAWAQGDCKAHVVPPSDALTPYLTVAAVMCHAAAVSSASDPRMRDPQYCMLVVTAALTARNPMPTVLHAPCSTPSPTRMAYAAASRG